MSVSLAVIQPSGEGTTKSEARDYWKKTIRGSSEQSGGETQREDRDRKSERVEEEEKKNPPKKMDGVGDEAYWSGNRFGGALYVLKDDVFIRISVGGPDNEAAKIEKSKRLAQKQRMGLLRGGGGAADRNLLDFFDINVDKDGRVVVGYVNGCSGGPCSQASPTAVGNAYTTTATIARQSSGRRLFVANDPASATSAPGMPFVTATRVNGVVKLAWNEADTGNLSISNYKIYRGTASGAETLLTSVGNVNSYTDTTATDPTQTYYYQVVAKNRAGSSPQRNEISVSFVGDTCSGLIIHTNPPGHPESTGGSTVGQPPAPQLLIDSIAVGEPPGTSNFMFKMKVGNLSSLPPNSRWRIVWDWVGPASNPNPDEQFFVGMRTDSNSAPTFEYGTVATLSLVVLGVPQENLIGSADPASNFNPDGTITIFVPKSAVGNPQSGDLLGAVNGRTFTGDTPETNTLERSTLLIDHTFVKGNTDNSYPAATYPVAGNAVCAQPTPSPTPKKKTH